MLTKFGPYPTVSYAADASEISMIFIYKSENLHIHDPLLVATIYLFKHYNHICHILSNISWYQSRPLSVRCDSGTNQAEASGHVMPGVQKRTGSDLRCQDVARTMSGSWQDRSWGTTPWLLSQDISNTANTIDSLPTLCGLNHQLIQSAFPNTQVYIFSGFISPRANQTVTSKSMGINGLE
ncbi:hypothetical protein F511_13075 [Dorcoceras hygrometricum]|uniref:Uncharacterized protein n=1 Tax=Dorcoceras hygrometricum TaxID=472368 RepID=A0A2Z7DHN5_9LAMI|nr:hypothetical protein F511_13075 [Dorcoceras hygrometricum]